MRMLGKRNVAFYCASLLGIFVGAYCLAFSSDQGPALQNSDEEIKVPYELQRSAYEVDRVAGEKQEGLKKLDSAIGSDEVIPQRRAFNSQKNAFRLVLEGEECRLLSIEKVSGAFRDRRGQPSIHPGILICRLLDSNGEKIAEERVHVPDHLCKLSGPVLGKNTNRVKLLERNAPIVFQVRLPVQGGERLNVYRVTETVPFTVESLILSVPVQK